MSFVNFSCASRSEQHAMNALWDVIVIGSGPAGQKAAVQAAKGNQRTCIVEREVGVGGACVHLVSRQSRDERPCT